MIKKIKETIEKNDMVKEGDSIVVGVSGGPDSVCLLHILSSIKDEYPIKLIGVHINHMLRGEAADDDEYYVKRLCEKLNIPYYVFHIDIKEMSKSFNMTEEEAGRKARYDAFFEVLRKTDSQKIAVAQNRNDQGETLLMRLMRGSGLDGLSGIPYKRQDTIIRPLLDIDRKQIEKYCMDNQLNPRIDHTNLEARYTRNKIRIELIPYMKENFNKNIIESLWKTTNILREDNDFIATYVDELFKKSTYHEENAIKIDKNEFQKQHAAIKKRMLLRCAKELDSDKDVSTIHLDNLINLIDENKTSTGIDWPNNLRIEIGYKDIGFYKDKSFYQDEFAYDFIFNGENDIKALGLCIKSKVISKEVFELLDKRKDINAFDYDKMNGKIEVRNRRKGDYIIPSGMKGKKKLKEYFVDAKIPKHDRYSIPLICKDSEVIWIIGYRANENYRVGKDTKKILLVEVKNRVAF